MKRFITLLLCLVYLLGTMTTVSVAAVTPNATLTSVSGKPGETVIVTVSLAGFETADAIGVQIDTDGALKLNGDSSMWLLSDAHIADIDTANKNATIALKSAQDVNKGILQLAFVIPELTAGQTNFNYPISCKVKVRRNGAELGVVTASGSITMSNPATGLTLDKSSLSLDLAGTNQYTLKATVTPANSTDKAVWTSDKESVATVENGVVTAHAKGTAKIKVTVGKYSKSCTVTVTCTHNYEEVPAKAATCQETGNKKYYVCKACDGVFDANKSTTTVEKQTIAKVAHSGGTATCTDPAVCSMCKQSYGTTVSHKYATTWSTNAEKHWHVCTTCNTAKKDEAAHTFQWKVDKAATEDATGLKHEECSVCKYKRNENTEIPKLDHVHVSISRHAAVAATCSKTGNVEYWTCGSSKCDGKYYGDSKCQTVLTTITIAVDPDNHTGGTVTKNAVTATCNKEGYSGDKHCKSCDKILTAGSVLPATGKHTADTQWHTDGSDHWHICTGCNQQVSKAAHTFQWKVDKAATEDATGLKHEECSVCKYKRNENTEIPKLDHVHVSISRHAAVAATCSKTGNVEYWTCGSNKCDGKYYGDSKCQTELTTIVTSKNPEKHVGGTELKNKVAATCVKEGYSGDTYCKSCSAMTKQGTVIPATGKHKSTGAYTQESDKHWRLCDECGAKTDNAGHTLTWVIDKAATETATGLRHQQCTVCKYVCNKDSVLAKLPHTPVLVEGKEPTCTEQGTAEHFFCQNCKGYYASNDGVIGAQIKETELTLEATGHTFAQEWTTDETNHWHTCTCGEKSEVAAHTTELIGAKEATETETGYTGDTVCTVCESTLSKGEEIPVVIQEEEKPVEEDVPVAVPEEEESDSKWIIILVGVGIAVIAILAIVLKKKK